jgi:hypothetical protein
MMKFFDEDLGSGLEKIRIPDLGWKKIGSGNRDKHPGSATLIFSGFHANRKKSRRNDMTRIARFEHFTL